MKRVSKGIFKTAYGFRVYVRVAPGTDGLRSKRFPPTATLVKMKAWRLEQQAAAVKDPQPTVVRGTFADDVRRYLVQVAAMPTLSWRKRDLETWCEAFGDITRDEITPAMIRAQLQTWRTEGPVIRFNPRTKERRAVKRPLSASACNHRRTALLHLYTVLDGKDAPNPVRGIKEFTEPAPEPRALDIEFLEAARLRMRNLKDRARVGVLLWTGARGNCELGDVKPEHLDLDGGACHLPTGKGGRRFRVVPLNARGVAAWRELIAVKALGRYDKNLLRRSFIRACRREAIVRKQVPVAVRPYDLRHSIATALLKAGADLSDVQDMLGHTTSRMTRRYAPFQHAKLAAAALSIDAQLPPIAEKVASAKLPHPRKRSK